MATPAFVAQKVGNEYILVPKDTPVQRPIWGAIGTMLLLRGFTRRDLPGLLLMAAGGAMAYRAATGLSPWHRFVCDRPARDAEGGPDVGPSYQHPASGVRQSPADEVDEAAMESFPASDPPARLRSTGDVTASEPA